MTGLDEDRRQLAAALHALRLDTGLSTAAFADRLGWSQSKVSKTELGRTLPKPDDVVTWAEVADAEPKLVDELLAIADRAGYQATEVRRALAPGRRRVQEDIQRLEAAASVIRVFAPVLVVGLAQTRAYADAVFRLGRRLGPPDESRADVVAARLARQAVLKNKTKRFFLLMGEAALHRRLIPSAAMGAQVNKLIRISRMPNVSLGVIPFESEQHAHQYHGFAILGDPEHDSESMVRVPTLTRAIAIRSDDETAEYIAHFEALWSAAVEGEELRELLRGVMVGLGAE